MRRLTWPSLMAAIALLLAACDTTNGTTPQPETYAVSGTITDGDNSPVPGVTVSFGNAADAGSTDADGEWERRGLNGTVTVTPTHAEYTFEPASREVSEAAGNVDFTGVPLPPST